MKPNPHSIRRTAETPSELAPFAAECSPYIAEVARRAKREITIRWHPRSGNYQLYVGGIWHRTGSREYILACYSAVNYSFSRFRS